MPFSVPSFDTPSFDGGGDAVVRCSLDPENGKKMDFRFNPASLSLDRKVSWSDQQAIKQPYGLLQFTGGTSDTLSMSVMLDGTEAGESVLEDVQALYAMTLPEIKEAEFHRPASVVFTWKQMKFVGVIDSIKFDFIMFDENGHPVRANVDLTLMGRAFPSSTSAKDFFAPIVGKTKLG